MGEIVQGVCKCGYESPWLSIGYGFAGPDYNLVLVVCQQCQDEISSVNLYLRRKGKRIERRSGPPCRNCKKRKTLLSDPALHSPSGVAKQYEEKFPWDVEARHGWHESVPEILYFCPQCKEIKMRLVEGGNWD